MRSDRTAQGKRISEFRCSVLDYALRARNTRLMDGFASAQQTA